MFCADWPHMWSGSTGPIHSWKRIGEILLLWRGNCIVTSTFSRKMHLNWKFCIIPCPSFFGNLLHLCAYVYTALKKIPTNIFMSFSSKLHVDHNQRGVGGHFLRPISQELCYIYLSIHIQYPSSKIRSMQIFIISPLKTTFMT